MSSEQFSEMMLEISLVSILYDDEQSSHLLVGFMKASPAALCLRNLREVSHALDRVVVLHREVDLKALHFQIGSGKMRTLLICTQLILVDFLLCQTRSE